jgi:uncharacterized membrane protein
MNNFQKIADILNFITAIFGVFIVIPTLFEWFSPFNGIAVNFMLVLACVQVLMLRMAQRSVDA